MIPKSRLNPAYAELAFGQNEQRAKTIAEVLRRVQLEKDSPKLWQGIAVLGIAFSGIIAVIQWLDGRDAGYALSMWIAALSTALLFATIAQVGLLTKVEEIVLDEGRKGGFKISKRNIHSRRSPTYSVALAMPIQQPIEHHDPANSQLADPMGSADTASFLDAMTAAAIMVGDDKIRREFAGTHREDMVGLLAKLMRLRVLGGPCELHPDPPTHCTICEEVIAASSFFVIQPVDEESDACFCGRCFLDHGDGVGEGIGEIYWAVGEGEWRAIAGTHLRF